MKKTLALLLTMLLAAGTVTACGKKDTDETKDPAQDVTTEQKDNTTTEDPKADEETDAAEGTTDGVDTSAYTAQGIVDSIYAQKAPAFMYGPIPVDLTDKDSYMTYLGIEDISKISDVAVSESMIGAQAYSLVVARVADGVDAKAVAEEMKNGINNNKWVCVTADDVKVTTYGDLICFCMIDTEYKEALTAQDVMDAFTNVVTGKADYVEASMEEETVTEDVTDGEITDEGIENGEASDETTTEENTTPSSEAEGEQDKVVKEDEKAETKPAVPEVEPEEIPVAPKGEEAPEVEDIPVVEETPVIDEEFIIDEEPVVDETPAVDEVPETDEDTVVVGGSVLDGMIEKMYAIKAPGFMLGTISVDMSDEFTYSTYLGIKDPSKITEAVVSEPMMGSQAYSLVIARVAPGQDASAVAAEMKAGIDPAKWVCVEADDIKTAVVGDLVCFCMISTDFASDYTAQDAIDAFKKVAA